MSFTYTQPWATSRDYVRFLIADRVSATALYQDEELDALLAEHGGDARMAAAEALEAIAGQYARNAIDWQVTGMRVDRRMAAGAILQRAKQLRDEARKVPFELESVLDEGVDPVTGEDFSNYPDTEP